MAKTTKNQGLQEDFLPELFRSCINKKDVFLLVKKYLKTSFLPEKSGFREIWTFLVRYHAINTRMPSIGIINQNLGDDEIAVSALVDIKNIVKPDYDGLLDTFGEFVKANKFVTLFDAVAEKYNDGEVDAAYQLFYKGSEELSTLSFRSVMYDSVFADFNSRFLQRLFERNNSNLDTYIPFGIDLLDYYTNGGVQKGEATLVLGDSGTGKSFLMIQCGLAAVRRGFRVAHFQAEGLKKQVLDRYDSAWTSTMYHEMKISDVPSKKLATIKKTLKKVTADIHVEAREKFGSWNMLDIRNSLIEMFKNYGEIDLVLIDYLDLIDPGDGKNYGPSDERFRQQAVAKSMKDIAVEFNVAVITPTQASSVSPEAKENPDFVLTRYNIAEDKGKIRPFDNFITINQTREEKLNGYARFFIDKLRENQSGQVIEFAQKLSRSKFYDRKRSLELYSEEILDMLKIEF